MNIKEQFEQRQESRARCRKMADGVMDFVVNALNEVSEEEQNRVISMIQAELNSLAREAAKK